MLVSPVEPILLWEPDPTGELFPVAHLIGVRVT